MCTNTYLPHVGGVARSVHGFCEEYRRRGHQVMVVAPDYDQQKNEEKEKEIIRVPAIQNFNGSDFALRLPVPVILSSALEQFHPDIVHSHHPFLLGDTAVRIAALYDVPLIFTHHTMYERYTHYVPGDSDALKRFVIEVSTGYSNLCDRVFAPSESIAAILEERGVDVPIVVVPTGVDVSLFAKGNRSYFRDKFKISQNDFVAGHVGRLAPEKNLTFLTEAVIPWMQKNKNTHFLIGGSGPSQQEMEVLFQNANLSSRVHFSGVCKDQLLVDIYHAMDVFVFTSKTETQGMVLTEAMAAGVPVIALDAPGAREVIDNERNGYLVLTEEKRTYTKTIERFYLLSKSEREAFSLNAQHTALQFSISSSGDRALNHYQAVIQGTRSVKNPEESAWLRAVRLFETEWSLLTTKAEAFSVVIEGKRIFNRKLLARMRMMYRQVVKSFSWYKALFRLFGIPVVSDCSGRGLLMIQVDGLSRKQLEQGLSSGKLKFLRKLLKREEYILHNLYSGVPSTTPSVQGELFYGVKQAVPAFSFKDLSTGKIVTMLEPDPALSVQQKLAQKGRGLLEGGSSYSNVFSGGATHAMVCSVSLGFGSFLRELSVFRLIFAMLLYARSLLRTLFLMVLEFFLALIDCVHGALAGEPLLKEIKFIPARIIVSIVLRELNYIGASRDMARGTPIIHLNLLGYDEHAHRRGASSPFAHWTLKGIDKTISRLYRVAKTSAREYDVWIYSDHGQQDVISYEKRFGCSLEDAIARVFKQFELISVREEDEKRGIQRQRAKFLRNKPQRENISQKKQSPIDSTHVDVTAVGPLGYIYFPKKVSADTIEGIASLLISEAKIPLVIAPFGDGAAQAWTREGKFLLPQDGSRVFGADHPFLEEVLQDLINVCHHPNAGNLTISGWSKDSVALSFVEECGAHAGPGPEEVGAFALLPGMVRKKTKKDYLRPIDLRQRALRVVDRAIREERIRDFNKGEILRIMSCDVHGCRGQDGRIAPRRVASLLAYYDPDIVILQGLGIAHLQGSAWNQASVVAEDLRMNVHFDSLQKSNFATNGIAVLSKHPIRLLKASSSQENNPDQAGRNQRLLWVAIEGNGFELNLVHAKYGDSQREQKAGLNTLTHWITQTQPASPLIVFAELKSSIKDIHSEDLIHSLRDAEEQILSPRPEQRWRARNPFRRQKRILVSHDIEVRRVDSPKSRFARFAAQSLPQLVEIRIS